MTNAEVIAHCGKCGRAFVHILFDGIECPYLDCGGYLHFDKTKVGRAYKKKMQAESAKSVTP